MTDYIIVENMNNIITRNLIFSNTVISKVPIQSLIPRIEDKGIHLLYKPTDQPD